MAALTARPDDTITILPYDGGPVRKYRVRPPEANLKAPFELVNELPTTPGFYMTSNNIRDGVPAEFGAIMRHSAIAGEWTILTGSYDREDTMDLINQWNREWGLTRIYLTTVDPKGNA